MNNLDKSLITKRFQTTMIGAIFEFEKTFGHLWGQFKSDHEPLTQSEEQFLDLWEDVRNRILNNGNTQLRKTISDLSKQDSVQYNYKFYKPKQGDE